MFCNFCILGAFDDQSASVSLPSYIITYINVHVKQRSHPITTFTSTSIFGAPGHEPLYLSFPYAYILTPAFCLYSTTLDKMLVLICAHKEMTDTSARVLGDLRQIKGAKISWQKDLIEHAYV